jgi:hypothetical protein
MFKVVQKLTESSHLFKNLRERPAWSKIQQNARNLIEIQLVQHVRQGHVWMLPGGSAPGAVCRSLKLQPKTKNPYEIITKCAFPQKTESNQTFQSVPEANHIFIS